MLAKQDFDVDYVEVYKPPKKKERKPNRFVLLLHALGWLPTMEWFKALRFNRYRKKEWAIWNVATQWGIFVGVASGKVFSFLLAKVPLAIINGIKATCVKVATFVTALFDVLQEYWT